jgi:hypothetical protein
MIAGRIFLLRQRHQPAEACAHTNRDAAEKCNELDQFRSECVSGSYRYYDWVLDALADHGLIPRSTTPPSILRDAVSDLYRYEIRQLRRDLLAGDIPKLEYANHVIALRKRYLLLSVPVDRWLVPAGDPAEDPADDKDR